MDRVKAPRWFWNTVAVVAVAGIATSVKTAHDTNATNERLEKTQQAQADTDRCVVAYLLENKRVSTARGAATSAKDEVLNRYIDGVTKLTLNPDPDPTKGAETFKMLTREYRAAAKKLRLERARNPLPDLPASCADLPAPE